MAPLQSENPRCISLPRTALSRWVRLTITFRRIVILCLTGFSLVGQPAPNSSLLVDQSLDEIAEPKLFLYYLNVAAGRTIPSHTHAGSLIGYVLEGEVENQLDPEPPKTFQPRGYFQEAPKQVHRLLRNLSGTDAAKILIFQVSGTLSPSITALIEHSFERGANLRVAMRLVTLAPLASETGSRQHSGPVVVYVVKGEIEDPDAKRTYRAGEAFYQLAMGSEHMRNVSTTQIVVPLTEVEGKHCLHLSQCCRMPIMLFCRHNATDPFSLELFRYRPRL